MPPTIMLVDDDPDDLALTRRTLIKTGRDLNIATASCGEEAIALLDKCGKLPALILLDIKMPGMTGIDLLCRLRATERLQNMPVVVVSNSSLEADKQSALDAGADAFLHKALDLNHFGSQIESQLQQWLDR